MSVTISQILEKQSALYGAVRGALTRINEDLLAQDLRMTEWPIEKAGCLYALALTLENSRTGAQLGECRFLLDAKGDALFDADDQPIAPCTPNVDVCEVLLAAFAVRRGPKAQTQDEIARQGNVTPFRRSA